MKCLSERDKPLSVDVRNTVLFSACIDRLRSDIGIIGAPFDTAVSYRPGKTVLTLLSKFSMYPAVFLEQ